MSFAILPAGAWGQSLEILGPIGEVPPEGFQLAVRRVGADGRSEPLDKLEPRAEGAELQRSAALPPLQTFWVVPRQGVREITVRAVAGTLHAEARYKLGPPASKVVLSLDPPAPEKNALAKEPVAAELWVRLLRPDNTPDADSAPPVLRSNVGSIEGLSRVGPGVYRARYKLPETLYPEVAVIVALCAWPHPQSIHGAVGSLRVPLASQIELPGQTERNAQFSMRISERTFGPVRSGPDGRFKIPVVVPPGFERGTGISVDRLGNRRAQPIDLMLPPIDQLACVVTPTSLRADGVSRARLLCATSDPFGKAMTKALVSVVPRRGTLSAQRSLGDGLLEWIYIAPRTLSAEPETLTATWRQGRIVSDDKLQIALLQGPAAKTRVELAEELVHYGGQLPIEVSVSDELNRPRPGAKLELKVLAPGPGGFGLVHELSSAPGKLGTDFVPGDAADAGSARLEVRAYGPLGFEPARIVAWAEGGALFAAVTDLAGLPVPQQTLVVSRESGQGAARVVTGEDGTAQVGPLADGRVDLRHQQWPGLRASVYVMDGGQHVFPPGERIGSRPERVTVALGPPVPVNVRLEVSGRSVTFWVERPDGKVILDRAVRVALSRGTRGPIAALKGRSTFQVTVDAPATVSIADVETGVTALAEVRP